MFFIIKGTTTDELNKKYTAGDTTLYSKCDQASDLWQEVELASELASDLQDTKDWGRKWFVHRMLEQLN